MTQNRLQPDHQIDSLNNTAWESVNTDLSLFYKYGFEALQLSNDRDYLFGRCESLQVLGAYYYYTGVLDSALIWYHLAIESRKEYGDSSMISGTLNNIAALYEKQGKLTQALAYFISADEYVLQTNLGKRARLSDNIGSIYSQLGNYSNALKYNQKATELFNKISPKRNDHLKNQVHKANIYELMSDFDFADSLYRNAATQFLISGDTLSFAKTKNNIGNIYLKQGKLEEALSLYLDVLRIYQLSGYSAEMAGTEQNLGLLYKGKGDYNSAASFFEDSSLKWRSLNNLQKLAELLINLGDLYLIQEKYLNAEEAFLEAQSISPVQLALRAKLYDGLFLTYTKRRMFDEALPYQLKYKNLVDSIRQEHIRWQNLESDFTRNQNKVLLLEKEKEAADERMSKERILRNFLMTGILFISLLTFLLYLNWKGKRKRLLSEKKSLEKQQQIERLLKDQELTSIRQVLAMQENERKRIAKDLHDRLGSMLSMVKLYLQKTSINIEDLKKLNQEEYKKANNLLDEACDEVRKIAHNLMSGVLQNFGLVAAMKELKTTLENTGHYEVELLTHQFEERLPLDYESAIYRIIQELVNNIIRHAKASEISIQFFRKVNLLQIIVEDNGSGFEVDKVRSKGMGLKNIESRLLSFNGTIVIDSHKDRGTSVIIEIPLNIES